MGKIVRLALLSIALSLPLAAEDRSIAVSSPVHGCWSVEGAAASMTFASPGVYSLDLDSDGKPEVNGTYLIEGDYIVFRDTDHPPGCPSAVGAYRYAVDAAGLRLELVKDSCVARMELFGKGWRRKS